MTGTREATRRSDPPGKRPAGLDGRRRALSDADRARIAELAEGGLRSTTIARMLGKRQPTVAGYLTSLGLTRTRQLPAAKPFEQNGKRHKRFDREEDAFIEQRSIAGDDFAEIARLCTERFGHPRKGNAIRARLRGLAGLDG